MTLFPEDRPYGNYTESVDMDSMPSLVHSTQSDVMELDSIPLEEHQRRLQQQEQQRLQVDQLRQQQEHLYQQRQQQQQQQEQQQQQQQQQLQQQQLHQLPLKGQYFPLFSNPNEKQQDEQFLLQREQQLQQQQQQEQLQYQQQLQQQQLHQLPPKGQHFPLFSNPEEMQQDEQFLADRERQLQQQRQQQERRSPLSQERDGPHPMWMKIPYPNDPVEAYIPAEVQPLSSPSSSSVGMPSLTFSSVEQSMRLSASLSSTQQLSGSPCRAHLPSPGSPPQVGVGVDGLNGTAHGPTGGAGMRARGGNNAEGANGVHGMNEMIDHEYFLTSALSMIPPEMLAHPGPPIPHFDYLTEFPQRQMMASGGNGQIRRAHWPAKGCYVILKCLMDTKHTPFQLELMFDKEVEVMKICGNHDNLVQFFGIATRNDPGNMERHMIMKFYEKGDLVNLLEKPLGHPDLPTIKERLYLALDITQGLEHLYNCGFHHGDLHPKNILIDDRQNDKHLRYQARLTDFGLRRIRNNTNLVSSQPLAGVWRFMAPERLQRNRARYDVRCDIFALGVIFWYLMSGRYPFKNNTEVPHNAREERIEGTPDWYYAMYTQAWSESPHHRQQDLRSIIQTIQTHLEKEPHELSGMDHPSWSHPSYPTPSLGYDSRMAPSPGRTLGSGGNYVGGHQYNAQQAYPTASASSGGSGVSPSANPETATITASSHAPKSSNPKHPRYKKPDIPNGMARRIGPR